MNINGNLSDSLQYPIKNWVKIIILGIILIIPIVNFIGLGYYLRIIKSTLAGLDELPDFERVGELFIDGIKIVIVCIIYAIVPLIFYALSFAFPGSVFFIIATIFVIIISIFAYMGIANMAYHDCEIGAALRYHEILDRIAAIGWGNYILWWIVLMLIITVAGFIIGIVGGILLFYVLGFPVFLLGYSYLVIFQARSLALTFVSSREYVDKQPKTSPIE
jgi:hypothetical protein